MRPFARIITPAWEYTEAQGIEPREPQPKKQTRRIGHRIATPRET